jgi:hypothetical protein
MSLSEQLQSPANPLTISVQHLGDIVVQSQRHELPVNQYSGTASHGTPAPPDEVAKAPWSRSRERSWNMAVKGRQLLDQAFAASSR